MAEIKRFNIKQNDVYPTLRLQLFAEDDPVDLSSFHDARFIMKNNKHGVKVSAPIYVTDQDEPENLGIVEYRWEDGDTDSVGDFDAEIEIEWQPGERQTFPTASYIRVRVYKELD